MQINVNVYLYYWQTSISHFFAIPHLFIIITVLFSVYMSFSVIKSRC